jgi:tetratricopeptide (TPR) repeat protein
MEAGTRAKTRGNDYMRSGQHLEAAGEYTKAIEALGETAILLANRAQAYLSLGRLEEALEDSAKAADLDPMYVKAHHRQGKALEGLKRQEEARKCFERILALDPTNLEAKQGIDRCPPVPTAAPPAIDLSPYMADSQETIQAVLVAAARLRTEGLEHLQAGRYTEAKSCLEGGLKVTMDLTSPQPETVNREKAMLFSALGEAYKGLKDLKLALNYHNTAVRLGKGSEDEAEILFKRGLTYQERAQSDLSRADFTQTLVLKPDFALAAQALARITHQEREETEKIAKQQAADLANLISQATVCKERGNSAFTRHDYDAATIDFSSGLSLIASKEHSQPHFASDPGLKTLKSALYSNRAACSLELNCNTFAIRDCKEVLALDPTSLKALYRLSQAYTNCGQFDLAIAQLEKALEREPGNKAFSKEMEALRKRKEAGEGKGEEKFKRKGGRKVSFKDFAAPGEDPAGFQLSEKKQEDIAEISSSSVPRPVSPPSESKPVPTASTEPPVSLTAFQTHIHSLHNNLPSIAAYLQSLNPTYILDLCGRYPLDIDLLTMLLQALQFVPKDLALVYLEGLAHTDRFALNVKMLSKADKGELAVLVQGMGAEADRLASLYHLS